MNGRIRVGLYAMIILILALVSAFSAAPARADDGAPPPPAAPATDTSPAQTGSQVSSLNEAAPTDSAPADAAPTDAAPTDVAPAAPATDVAPTDAAPTDVPPTDVASTEAVATDAAPTAAAPTDVPPTDVAPTECSFDRCCTYRPGFDHGHTCGSFTGTGRHRCRGGECRREFSAARLTGSRSDRCHRRSDLVPHPE